MLRAVDFSHALLRERLYPGDVAIDATAGNGHDTHFLAQLVGRDGMVYAFDVQESAIAATARLMDRWGVPPSSYQLISAGHETMRDAIPARHHGQAGAVVFNLGYLPGSDKSVVTRPDTTLAAIEAALSLLRPGGILVTVLYTGHPGGMEEAEAVRTFAAALPHRDWHVIEFRTVNARHEAPGVLVFEKPGSPAEPDYII